MQSIIQAIGGRKMVIIVIAIALVALRNVLDLDSDQVKHLILVALGGSGTIALEDSIKSLAGTKKKK